MFDSVKYFLYFALCFFGIIWLFNFHKLTQLEERYNKALQEHEKLLTQDSINQCIFDSLQYQLDSLHLRYQIFDSAPGRDFIDIMNAIIQVESRGNPKAHALDEDAVGILPSKGDIIFSKPSFIIGGRLKPLSFFIGFPSVSNISWNFSISI